LKDSVMASRDGALELPLAYSIVTMHVVPSVKALEPVIVQEAICPGSISEGTKEPNVKEPPLVHTADSILTPAAFAPPTFLTLMRSVAPIA